MFREDPQSFAGDDLTGWYQMLPADRRGQLMDKVHTASIGPITACIAAFIIAPVLAGAASPSKPTMLLAASIETTHAVAPPATKLAKSVVRANAAMVTVTFPPAASPARPRPARRML